jgi:hypothetical protein
MSMKKYRRVFVTLPTGVWRVVDELKDAIGDNDAEVIRNIVIAYLSERGVLIPSYKAEGFPSTLLREIREQNAMVGMLLKELSQSNNPSPRSNQRESKGGA